jgi:type I restriction enzyme S subunit
LISPLFKVLNHNLEQMARAIFNEQFGDEEPNRTLGEIASITSGKRPYMRQANSSAEAKIPLIGASSIMGYTNKVLYNEKILITGRVGTHGIIQRYSRPCWASDNTLFIKSDYYEFAYQQLLNVDFANMNRGTSQPLITQTDLKNVPIFIPTQTTLCEFEKSVDTLMEQYECNIRESEYLATLRDTLLPRLMGGKLTVDG